MCECACVNKSESWRVYFISTTKRNTGATIPISGAVDRLSGEERTQRVCTRFLKYSGGRKNWRETVASNDSLGRWVENECVSVCGLPARARVFGEDPETLSEHSILAVSHGYTMEVSDRRSTAKDGPATANSSNKTADIRGAHRRPKGLIYTHKNGRELNCVVQPCVAQ